MEFSDTKPLNEGMYGYRLDGQADTYFYVPNQDSIIPSNRVGYFPMNASAVLIWEMPGQFCGPFVLPE